MIMRKWTYLVAMLMLAGATTTFTGCIDTDEPAGIEKLRGAKADLLKAKEAVEVALAAEKQANAALILAQVKTEEANAAYRIAEAKKVEAEAKKKELEAEKQAIQNEEERARVDAQIAYYESQIAEYKADIEKAAKQFEVDMKTLEKELAEAEALYIAAVKNLALAEASMTTEQQAAITAAKGVLSAAKSTLDAAEQNLYDANKTLYGAMLVAEYDNYEAVLNYDLKVAQYKLDAAKQAEAIAKENSEKDVEATDWEKELDKIKAYAAAQDLFIDSLNVELENIHINNKAAWDSVQIAKDEYLNRVNSQNGIEYAFSEYVNNTLDTFPAVKDYLVDEGVTVDYGYQETPFELAKWYNGSPNNNGLENLGLTAPGSQKILIDSIEGNTDAKNFIAAFDTKIDALENVKRTLNQLIKDTLDQNQIKWDENIEYADSVFTADSLEWEVLVAAMKGEKTEPTDVTDDFKEVITAFNTKYAEVAPAIVKQNTAIANVKAAESAVALAAYNAAITAGETAVKDSLYMSEPETKAEIKDSLKLHGSSANKVTVFEALCEAKEWDVDLVKSWLTAAAKTRIQHVADSIWKKDWKDGNTITTLYNNEIKTPAEATKESAIVADIKKGATSQIMTAYKAYKEANDSITTGIVTALDTKINDFNIAYAQYQDTLATGYGQKVKTKYDNTGNGSLKIQSTASEKKANAKFTLDAKTIEELSDSLGAANVTATLDSVKLVANCTDISAAEITALTTTELLPYATIEGYWKDKSSDVWGVNDRMIPLAEEDVDLTNNTGSYAALLKAIKDKADMNEVLGANAVVDRLIAELTAQKDVAQGELNAAIAAAEAAYADYVAKIDTYATLDDDIEAQKEAATHLSNNYNRIVTKLKAAINAYYGNGTYTYTDFDSNQQTVSDAASMKEYLFFEYLKAQKAVIIAEKDVLDAEKALVEFNDGLYDGVSEATKLVEKATEAYEEALKEYTDALNALNALLAALAE